jgi:hypothetical protein
MPSLSELWWNKEHILTCPDAEASGQWEAHLQEMLTTLHLLDMCPDLILLKTQLQDVLCSSILCRDVTPWNEEGCKASE